MYELENGSDVIIIKEWSFLLGSGAEIYYKAGDEKPVLLGQISGGDDRRGAFIAVGIGQKAGYEVL